MQSDEQVNIFDFNSRLKLERQGLSSGKRRRKVQETGFLVDLEDAMWAKAALFGTFSVGTILLILLARDSDALFRHSPLESVLLIGSIIVTLVIQFLVSHSGSFASNRKVLLTLAAIFLHLALILVAFAPVQPAILPEKFRYVLPAYAMAPMALSILLGRSHGTFVAIYVSLLGALLVSADKAFEFTVLSLVSGFVAVYLTNQLRRRSSLIVAGLFVGLATGVMAVATGQIAIDLVGWRSMMLQFFTAVMVGLGTAMVVSGALPFLESWFRITTVFAWLELSDLNHPLLRQMNYEAPGTHHHSLMVAQLAERAAEAIGANPTMCRAGAYFHDIGKLSKPQYFIENTNPDDNPHDELTPTMSALILQAHVKDGVDLALKHGLNQEIISVIREHHGTSIIHFFHHKALEQRARIEAMVAEGKAEEEDIPVVQESDFRYPGPKPRSRESAIISLADVVESTSRSLAKPTPMKLAQMISDITEKKVSDGQLDDCDLTLGDLTKIRKSFHSTLCGAMHHRVPYPGEPVIKKKRLDADKPRERERGAGGGKNPAPKPAEAALAKQTAATGSSAPAPSAPVVPALPEGGGGRV